jgi:putative oxidoreductase
MSMTDNQDVAALLLRLVVGGFQLPHGLQKFGLLGGQVEAATESFTEYGLRPPRAWVRAIGTLQIVCGVLLVLGLATVGAAALTMCLCLGMVNVGLRQNGWYWNRHGMEYAVFWAIAAACLALLGPGAWSLDAALAH